MKTTVYSWRITVERKAALEEIAHRQQRSVAELIDEAVGRWLEHEASDEGEERAQARVRQSALRAIGRIAGGDPERAAQARSRIREELHRKRGEPRQCDRGA